MTDHRSSTPPFMARLRLAAARAALLQTTRLPAALLLTTVLAAATAVPAAAERELYFGYSLGRSTIDLDPEDAVDQLLDGEEDTNVFEVGYRFSDYLAVEATYYDLSETDGAIQGKINAISAAIVPQYSFTSRISVFAKVGIVAWDVDTGNVSDSLDFNLEEVEEEDLIYGVGAQFGVLGRLKVVARFESIAGDIEIVSAGIRVAF